MRARVRNQGVPLIMCMLLLLLVATAQCRNEDESDFSTETETETEYTTTLASVESSTQPNNDKQLVYIENLQKNCHLKRGTVRCSGFRFDDIEKVAFFSLPTQVRIAPDGATYELGDKQHLGTLIMENSTFINFPLHLFYELPLLSEVDMRDCGMQYVSWEGFLAANKLKILLLSGNAISELGESSFSYASELEFLFLSDNKLSSPHPDAFKGLQNLIHLDLSDNQLEELPERIFHDLAALHTLIISGNRLRFISNGLLTQNTRLQTVILQGNQLQQLGEYAFSSAPHLLHLDVSHNAPLEVLVLNLNVVNLRARNCSLTRVNLFGAVTNVDLSDNRVQELYFSTSELLEDLVLRNNSLGQLATLSRVPRLRHLDVGNNPQLGELPTDWQKPHLERLDLSNTGLQQLPQQLLEDMPNLRKLNVSNNKISDIDPHDFKRLSRLTHFYIHANNWNCFSLRMVMDVLILQHGITYTPDKVDDDFMGSYIKGIACMYRLPEREQLKSQSDTESSASVEYSQHSDRDATSDVEMLRREFKAVVQHLEQKFDSVFAQLSSLNAKMNSLEHMNSSLWNQLTITV
ncbi:nephrocan [Drosophila grimshawi]|uniref:GH19410 n=1 Tax=Drosophila grimshawi TaxID=7222 RepID=B4JG41_DROGR|nr:nephrocan [Drosophila grimshawi]EDV93608.1 GH19410 [Drosophila grimshawi]